MKNLYSLLLFLFLSVNISAQTTGEFYINILSPEELYQCYGPEEYGVAVGFAWDSTIEEDVEGALIMPSEEDWAGGIFFCEEEPSLDFTGKIAIVDRGSCFFSIKAYHAQQAGAIGIIIVNFEEDAIDMAGSEFADLVTIPTVMLPRSVGLGMQQAIAQGTEVIINFSQNKIPIATFNGTLRIDENKDCLADEDEISIAGWKIHLTNGANISRIILTDENGQFKFRTKAGNYKIQALPEHDIWQSCDLGEFEIELDQTIEVNPLVSTENDCSIMTVELEPFFLRRCFDGNHYVLKYCNLGSLQAEEAYVDVEFDELLMVDYASQEYESLGDNKFRFRLGNVDQFSCGQLNIFTTVSCDAVLGQVLCAQADIYPKENCDNIDYRGAYIKVDGICNGDQVQFSVSNFGDGDMNESQTYHVFRNSELLETGEYLLNSGSYKTYSFEADGATYRLEVKQVDEYPIITSPSHSIEACVSGNDEFDTGYLLQYKRADYGDSFDESCHEVRGAYDPNDKTPTPYGYGEEGFIEKNTDLYYKIRFQNSGTDTAFNVVIKDQLSENLDVASIKFGPSSHPYELKVNDANLMEFRFDNIMLPDSNINEPASHGFITYTIKQKKDLELGTEIYNRADIYFDFNEAILTNTTLHTIGENFLNTVSVESTYDEYKINVFPNPSQGQMYFQVEGIDLNGGALVIYDRLGRMIDQFSFQESIFTYNNARLSPGHYFFRINNDEKQLGFGKFEVIK